jgi:transposase
MSEEQTKLHYTVREGAKRIGVSERIMRDYIRRYEIKAYDVSVNPGRGKARWRITEEAIQDFLVKRSNQPTNQPNRRRTIRRPSKTYV